MVVTWVTHGCFHFYITRSLATNIHKKYGVFLILYIFNLFQSLNLGLSDPEADDIPMCHRASLFMIHFHICSWSHHFSVHFLIGSLFEYWPKMFKNLKTDCQFFLTFLVRASIRMLFQFSSNNLFNLSFPNTRSIHYK